MRKQMIAADVHRGAARPLLAWAAVLSVSTFTGAVVESANGARAREEWERTTQYARLYPSPKGENTYFLASTKATDSSAPDCGTARGLRSYAVFDVQRGKEVVETAGGHFRADIVGDYLIGQKPVPDPQHALLPVPDRVYRVPSPDCVYDVEGSKIPVELRIWSLRAPTTPPLICQSVGMASCAGISRHFLHFGDSRGMHRVDLARGGARREWPQVRLTWPDKPAHVPELESLAPVREAVLCGRRLFVQRDLYELCSPTIDEPTRGWARKVYFHWRPTVPKLSVDGNGVCTYSFVWGGDRSRAESFSPTGESGWQRANINHDQAPLVSPKLQFTWGFVHYTSFLGPQYTDRHVVWAGGLTSPSSGNPYPVDPSEDPMYIVAFERRTGKQIWMQRIRGSIMGFVAHRRWVALCEEGATPEGHVERRVDLYDIESGRRFATIPAEGSRRNDDLRRSRSVMTAADDRLIVLYLPQGILVCYRVVVP